MDAKATLIWVTTALLALPLCPPVRAQSAEYYRGTAVNSEMADRAASLEFSIFQHTDSGTVGWLQVGSLLGGTGYASVVLAGLDSLYLVSVSQTADTIVWASATRAGVIGGTYWVRGGPYAGQVGTWRLEPRQRLPAATLVLCALFVGVAVVLAVYGIAVYSCDRWWRWQAGRPPEGTTQQASDWQRLEGWLALFVLGGCILVVYLLVGLKSVASDDLGSTWMLGAALPGLRPMLLTESAAHLFQLIGVSVGLLLIFRRSPIAPPYWVALLLTTVSLAVYDLVAVQAMLPNVHRIFGSETASTFTRETQTAQVRNARAALSAAVWSLYWLRSRRVRVRFSPMRGTLRPIKPVSVDAPAPSNEGAHVSATQPLTYDSPGASSS